MRHASARPLEMGDAAVLAALWADPQVTRHMGGPRDPADVWRIVEAEARAGSPDPIRRWPVVERASGRVVGECGLVRKEAEGRAEIVYIIAADSWGKGYATEAALAVRDRAVGHLGLWRLIALIDPENAASARVTEKIGMRFERDTIRPGGKVRRVSSMRTEMRRHGGLTTKA